MRRIALLRGINVSGRNKVPMKELVGLCQGLGWTDVQTLLQTGNVIFSAEGSLTRLENHLEKSIEDHFGFSIPVIIREAKTFVSVVKDSPLEVQATTNPSKVILYMTKEQTRSETFRDLSDRAKSGEEIVVQENSIWIYFPKGVGSSKLTPAVIDRAAGTVATGRNWNTAHKIYSICSEG